MKASTTLISITTLFLFACGGETSLGGLDGGNPASGAGGAGTTAATSSAASTTASTTMGAGGKTSGTTTGGSGGSSAGQGGSSGGGTGGKIPIDAGDPCLAAKCPAGTFCVAEPVACIPEANCPPFAARCEVSCGGFAAFPCPGLGTCVDNPYDNCDPMRGGADCGGLCRCTAMAKCSAGQVWDSSPTVCSCVGGPDAGGDAGPLCGKIRCAAGKVCCNPVMDICTDPGMTCIQ
jgi:hypothetical protein